MFELALNTVKVATSKDVRNGIASVVELLTRSPEWQRDSCAIDVTVTNEAAEKLYHLETVVEEKLSSLAFPVAAQDAFRTSLRELFSNAVQHGASGDPRTRISVSIEICPTFVSVTVLNPSGKSVSLPDCFTASSAHLRETKQHGRGRGLFMTYARADTLSVVGDNGDNGVKAVTYRDRVSIKSETRNAATVVVPVSGFTNPSIGRRIVDYLKRHSEGPTILCLDPKSGTRYLTGIRAEEKASRTRLVDSTVVYSIVSYIHARADVDDSNVYLVVDDVDVFDLLPEDNVYQTVAAARRAIRDG